MSESLEILRGIYSEHSLYFNEKLFLIIISLNVYLLNILLTYLFIYFLKTNCTQSYLKLKNLVYGVENIFLVF